MMPTSIGARRRHTLDRDSDLYKQCYRERTAVERINSQTVALGIERPHLRHGTAIANQNTLIYLLINLRFLQCLRGQVAENWQVVNEPRQSYSGISQLTHSAFAWTRSTLQRNQS